MAITRVWMYIILTISYPITLGETIGIKQVAIAPIRNIETVVIVLPVRSYKNPTTRISPTLMN